MKTIKLFILVCLLAGASACNDIINPNVREDDFLNSPGAMQSWVNGANKTFAQVIGSFAELTEILSDNYYNNYTQSSKVFDSHQISYTDNDVTALQGYIGTLRETADYGLYTVAPVDTATKDSHLFNLYYIKGYSYLLAGEYFTALPVEAGGEVVKWKDQLTMAADTFKAALHYAGNREDTAFIHTLIARAYHKASKRDSATVYAKAAHSPELVKFVDFDGNHGVINNIQTHVASTHFQPLPRLDFLDPKYFQLGSSDQRSIAIAKAEEPYLILAEAALADNNINDAKTQLKTLLNVVKKRPTAQVNDILETRGDKDTKFFPGNNPKYTYVVRASEEDPFRDSLVLNRRSGLIEIPYISGTSVDSAMVAAANSVDSVLELVYLMRQEIFFAEGRRASDLGFRLPLCESEAAIHPAVDEYIHAQILDSIRGKEIDAFRMDTVPNTDTVNVTIRYNMNKVIVANKNTEYVVPLFPSEGK